MNYTHKTCQMVGHEIARQERERAKERASVQRAAETQ